MDPNAGTQSPRRASRIPAMNMRQMPTPQIRTLETLVGQYKLKLWDIYGRSTTDVEGWRRATVLEWQALVHFHSDLAVACLLLLLMTKPLQSSIGLSREIWQGVEAFFCLYDHLQLAPTEPAIAMIDTAACIMALLYFYEPTDREGCFHNLRDLGTYQFVSSWGILTMLTTFADYITVRRQRLSTPVGNISEELTWALVVGYTRSVGASTMDAESAVKSLLQLKSIRRCGKCIDQIVARFVFGLYLNSLPNRGAMSDLFFLPANAIYDSVLGIKRRRGDEAAWIDETTSAPTLSLNGEGSGWGTPYR